MATHEKQNEKETKRQPARGKSGTLKKETKRSAREREIKMREKVKQVARGSAREIGERDNATLLNDLVFFPQIRTHYLKFKQIRISD